MTRKFLKHAICWMLFILYEISLARYMGDQSGLLQYGCFYLLSIALFYLTASVVLRRLPAKGSFSAYVSTGLFILLELGIYSYLSVILNNAFRGFRGVRLVTHVEPAVLMSAGWRGIYFIALSGAYFAILRAINAVRAGNEAQIRELKAINKSERLEKEILILRNAYLQARVNPHFLFNTLSFIYNQAEEGDPDTARNISLLSEIMQYSLTSMEKDGKVALYRELNQIKRYISLNLSRFGNNLFLENEIVIRRRGYRSQDPAFNIIHFYRERI